MWQQIYWKESTDSTQRRELNSNQHEDSDILTIGDSSKNGEWREMDASGRDVCPSSSSRCFLDLCNESIIATLIWD